MTMAVTALDGAVLLLVVEEVDTEAAQVMDRSGEEVILKDPRDLTEVT